MARANVYNKEEKSKKGLFITIISLVVVLLAAGITCVCLWHFGYFNGKEEHVDAFEGSNYKISYSDLKIKLENANNQTEHIMVFTYDSETFNEDNKDYDYEIVKTRVDELITAINTKNESYGKLFSFYLIDTSVDENNLILQDSTYGFSANTEDDKTLEGANPNFFYYYNCEWNREAPESLKGDLPSNKDYELGGLKYSERSNIARVLSSAKMYVNDLMNQNQ